LLQYIFIKEIPQLAAYFDSFLSWG